MAMTEMGVESRPGRSGKRRVLCALVGLLGAFLVGAIALTVWQTKSPTLPPPPEDNRYGDLLSEAELVALSVGGGRDISRAPATEIRAALEANRESLRLVRKALDGRSQVPLRFDPSEIQAALDRSTALRGLGRLLLAEGKLAEQDGRIADAVRSDLDLIRLGQAVGRGGLLVESQTGLAIESQYGYEALKSLRPRIPSEKIPEVIHALEVADARAEPFAVLRDRELQFAKNAHGWTMRLLMSVSPSMMEMVHTSLEVAELGYRRVQTKRRLLMADLAVGRYHERHGSYPERLADLVPEFLEKPPEDPFGRGLLRYRRSESGFLLYSVGPDGDDDGGKPARKVSRGSDGDLNLQSSL